MIADAVRIEQRGLLLRKLHLTSGDLANSEMVSVNQDEVSAACGTYEELTAVGVLASAARREREIDMSSDVLRVGRETERTWPWTEGTSGRDGA